MREKSKRNNKRLLLVVLLLIVTIGYATLQTSLTINGTSKINNATWNVHFETVTPTPGSVTIDSQDNTQYAARIDTNDNTKVGFSVLLNEPGDFYEFTVKAVNSGSIDAMVDTVTKTLKIDNELQNSIPTWLTYTATYSDGVEIVKNHLLAHESFETYKIRVELNKNISNAQYEEATGKTLTLDFDVKYVQKGEGAIPVSHERYLYTINEYDRNFATAEEGTNTTVVYLNKAIPNGLSYNSRDEAMQAFGTRTSFYTPVYLRHKIENGIVSESYVDVVIDDTFKAQLIDANCEANEEECIGQINSLVNGSYSFRGGVDEGDASGEHTVYLENVDSMFSLFGSEYCDSFDEYYYNIYCENDYVYMYSIDVGYTDFHFCFYNDKNSGSKVCVGCLSDNYSYCFVNNY